MGQVYIEDYVVAFLKHKKTEATDTPVKLALYGTIHKPKTLNHLDNDDETSHYIYGAAALEENRASEEIGDEYFPAYQLLGYVSIRNSGGEAVSKYHIFYDENTAMQDYLLYYYMRAYSAFRSPDGNQDIRSPFQTTPELSASELDNSLRIVKSKKSQKKGDRKALLLGKLKMFIFGALCLLIATSIGAINDYDKLSDFAGAAKLAVSFRK